ncbi:hypothetical protein PLESTM_002054000 [Pleodorina starrii]|nr:hypothetical protein PLESTM_002054000 [Pleodorina starrii]
MRQSPRSPRGAAPSISGTPLRSYNNRRSDAAIPAGHFSALCQAAGQTRAASAEPWSVEREVFSLRRNNTATTTTTTTCGTTAAAPTRPPPTAVAHSPIAPPPRVPAPATSSSPRRGGGAAARELPFPSAAQYMSYSSLAGPPPPPPPPLQAVASESAATASHTVPPSHAAPAGSAAPPAGEPAAAAATAARADDSDSEVEVLAVRMKRLGIRPKSSTATAGATGSAAAAGSRPQPPPSQREPFQQLLPVSASTSTSTTSSWTSCTSTAGGPTEAPAIHSTARAPVPNTDRAAAVRPLDSTEGRERTAAAAAVVSEGSGASLDDCRTFAAAASTSFDATAVTVATGGKPALRRRGAAAAAAGAPATAEAAHGAAAAAPAKPASRGGRAAKAKPGRCGKAPGGALLWTEMSEEERAAAVAVGDRGWIRWEPLPSAADEDGGDGCGGGPAPLFHLFSVDIETVDFMRGRQAFPRPDQVRLLEVAAVDLGPYQQASEGLTDPRVGGGRGGGGGSRGGRVFSTLINCGRSFKSHKTIMHNGISWAESSAPGVPYTAEALQRLFGFINSRCAATAAAAAAAAAVSEQRVSSQPPPAPPRVIPVLMAHNGTVFDFPVLRSSGAPDRLTTAAAVNTTAGRTKTST